MSSLVVASAALAPKAALAKVWVESVDHADTTQGAENGAANLVSAYVAPKAAVAVEATNTTKSAR